MLLNNNSNNNQNSQGMSSFIYILYVGLIIYFIYRLYKTKKAEKELSGEVHRFKRAKSRFMSIVMIGIAAFSLFSIYNNEYIMGILMLVLVITLQIELTLDTQFAENGFIADSKFIEWKELKKWAFDSERSELVLSYKKGFEEKQAFIKVRKQDINEIDKIIRKYKLNK